VLPGTNGPDKPNVYTPLTSSAYGYTILPPGYGIKMFELGSRGDLVPVEVSQNKDRVNLVAYGVAGTGKTIAVTLINREYGPKGKAAEVWVETGKSLEKGETITMSQEKGDIAQVEGVSVGGASIGEDGAWNGGWRPLTNGIQGSRFKIEVPPATAMVVRVKYQ